MKRYVLSPSATDDIQSIRRYTREQWGQDQARAYGGQLRDRMRWLAQTPARGKARDDLGQGLYSYPEGRHTIFYRVSETGIGVVRVLHQSMDMERHLP